MASRLNRRGGGGDGAILWIFSRAEAATAAASSSGIGRIILDYGIYIYRESIQKLFLRDRTLRRISRFNDRSIYENENILKKATVQRNNLSYWEFGRDGRIRENIVVRREGDRKKKKKKIRSRKV